MSKYIDKTELRNGVTQYTYWDTICDVPLGILWVRIYIGEMGKRIGFLLNTMTAYYYRRRGVCTALSNTVLNDVDVFLAGSGSKEGGSDFLKNFGFKYNKQLDMWCFIRKGV